MVSNQVLKHQNRGTGIYRWSIILADTGFYHQSESVSAASSAASKSLASERFRGQPHHLTGKK